MIKIKLLKPMTNVTSVKKCFIVEMCLISICALEILLLIFG